MPFRVARRMSRTPLLLQSSQIMDLGVVEAGPSKLGRDPETHVSAPFSPHPGCGERSELSTESHNRCPEDVVSPHPLHADPQRCPEFFRHQAPTAAPHKLQTTWERHPSASVRLCTGNDQHLHIVEAGGVLDSAGHGPRADPAHRPLGPDARGPRAAPEAGERPLS